MHRRTTLNILIGLLLASSIVATMPVASGQNVEGILPEQNAAIKANQGIGAPYGSWQRVGEEVTLYLDRTAEFEVPATPIGSETPAGNGDGPNDYFVHYEKSPAVVKDADPTGELSGFVNDLSDPKDKKVIVESSPVTGTYARWTVPVNLMPTAPVRVYGLEARIFADCVGEPTFDGTPGLQLDMDILDLQEDGSWVRRDMSGSTGHQPYKTLDLVASPLEAETDVRVFGFLGEARFENPIVEDGRLFETGKMRMQFSVIPAQSTLTTQGNCVIHFGSATFPSFVRVLSDSGRINMWNENMAGEVTEGVSAGLRTAPEKRHYLTQVIHASAWPSINAYNRTRVGPVNYLDDFWDITDGANGVPNGPGDVTQGSSMLFRVRDLTSMAIVSGTGASNIQVLDRQVFPIGNSVNRVQYELFYPENLRDGRYRSEGVSTEFGQAVTPDLTVGLKGFTFTALDSLTHAINPGEATDFRFRVRNFGGESDTVTVVASPPGNSWSAEVIGASTHFLKANGGEAEIVLRVTSPSSAVAGSSQTISMVASSSTFPGELTPITRTVTVNVVSAVARDVEVTANRTTVIIQPGVDTSLGGIRVENLGTRSDTFVLQPSVPAVAQGWTVQATPLSKEILGASSSDFSVRIRAPANAASGQSFTIGLTAGRLGDLTVTDTVDITVVVQIVNGVVLAPYQTTADLRNRETCPSYPSAGPTPPSLPPPAPSGPPTAANGVCLTTAAIAVRDNDFDRSSVFRVVLTNPSGVEDTYRITGTWKTSGNINGVSISESDTCDGTGRPDHWRYRFGNRTQPNNAPDGTSNFIRTVTLKAGASEDLFLELGYNHAVCGLIPNLHAGSASQAAGMTVTFRSLRDPSKEQAVLFGAHRMAHGAFEGNGDYAGAVRGVDILADPFDADAKAGANPGQKVAHTFRVVNTGNERDTLVVQVPAGGEGWTRELQFVNTTPAGISCSGNAARTRFTCPGMGINDEATFRLNVTPSSTKPIGENDRALVSVTSGDEGSISDSLELLTTVLGTYQFDASALAPSLTAERGKTTFLPFVMKNLGTSGDRLNISLVQGDASWTPRLGTPATNFVPAGKDLAGFLIVNVPADASVPKLFRLQVTSAGNNAIDVVDFTVTPVASGALRVAGTPSNVTTIPEPGVTKAVDVVVTEPSGTVGRTVRLDVLTGSLPAGWSITPSTTNVTLTGSGNPTATATFQVLAPAEALANSRVPLLIRATSTSGSSVSGQGSLLVQLADVFGVKLAPDGPLNQTIVPGGQVVYNLTVANLGTSTDTVRLSTSAAPAGWIIQTDPPELALGPLENRSIQLLVRAPVNAAPRALAATTLQAASVGSGAVSTLAFTTRVGFYELLVNGTSETLSLAPTETVSRVYTLKNNGTVPDEVVITPVIVNAALASQVTLRSDPAVVQLAPNQTKDVRVDFTLGAAPPSDSDINTNVLFASRLAPLGSPANATLPAKLHVLRYAAIDADADGINEYAVDRNLDTGDGFEQYLDTGVGGGKASRIADIERFLSQEARAQFVEQVTLDNGTTIEVFDQVIDGDGDGRRDLLVDSTGDGLPDHYWDPDGSKRQDITVIKDIDADAVPDYFIDTDGSPGLDKVYNLRTGEFTNLLTRDIDRDGTADYVVDKNGNGQLDPDETVLYSRNGRLITVQKVDMDGNGQDDDVFDIDGDGTPDYFVPAGEEEAVEIVVKDMDGDGNADWAYDTDGDGRLDAYYSPSTGETGLVDAASSFQKALKEYWYIPALFGVVLVLFVVLLLVTRR